MTTKRKPTTHECEDFAAGRSCRCEVWSRLSAAVTDARRERERLVLTLRDLSRASDAALDPRHADLIHLLISIALEKAGIEVEPYDEVDLYGTIH